MVLLCLLDRAVWTRVMLNWSQPHPLSLHDTCCPWKLWRMLQQTPDSKINLELTFSGTNLLKFVAVLKQINIQEKLSRWMIFTFNSLLLNKFNLISKLKKKKKKKRKITNTKIGTYRKRRLQSRFAQLRCLNSKTLELHKKHLANEFCCKTSCVCTSLSISGLNVEGGSERRASKTNKFPTHPTEPSFLR